MDSDVILGDKPMMIIAQSDWTQDKEKELSYKRLSVELSFSLQ